MPPKVHPSGVGEKGESEGREGRQGRRKEVGKGWREEVEGWGKGRGLKATLEEQEVEQLETNTRREEEVRYCNLKYVFKANCS